MIEKWVFKILLNCESNGNKKELHVFLQSDIEIWEGFIDIGLEAKMSGFLKDIFVLIKF
jgi:hypothetical protein